MDVAYSAAAGVATDVFAVADAVSAVVVVAAVVAVVVADDPLQAGLIGQLPTIGGLPLLQGTSRQQICSGVDWPHNEGGAQSRSQIVV